MTNPARDTVSPFDFDINEMIGVPDSLEAYDGRRYTISKWCPIVDFEEGIVRIQATLILRRAVTAKMNVSQAAARGVDVTNVVSGGTKVKGILAKRKRDKTKRGR